MVTETLDIIVTEPHKTAILGIVKHIRPNWDAENMVFKALQGGYLNRLYYCAMNGDLQESDVVLLRVNGASIDALLDRDQEAVNIAVAHSLGLASRLYCRFMNGLVYKYARGDILTVQTATDDTVARATARKLAALHLVDYYKVSKNLGYNKAICDVPFVVRLKDMVPFLMTSIQNSYDDLEKDRVRDAELPHKDDAFAELLGYTHKLEALGFPKCFCHCDAHPLNIIHDFGTGDITLIDWELSGIDYAVHEIGWYFAGKLMMDNCAEDSLKLYPGKNYQLKWIRWYLEYTAELSGLDPHTVTPEEVNNMYRGSILAAMIRIIAHVMFFLMKDHTSPDDGENFRKARHFQSLYRLVQARHTTVEEEY